MTVEHNTGFASVPLAGNANTSTTIDGRFPKEGWHSRGYLPHCEARNLQFITFRLYDSVPKEVILKWKEQVAHESDFEQANKLLRLLDQYEDAGKGSCYLKDDRIAKLVQDALLFHDGKRYKLLNWCIMPNHVHVLIEKFEGVTLSGILHSWRSFTAHKANEILGRTGDFWMKDYFDRFIRDESHLNATIRYIENNPVKAGLANEPEDWPWSSACYR